MSQNITFTPEHKQLSNIFGEGARYVIPSYQRPYSWESQGKSDKNNQVNNIWDDLIEFFEANQGNVDEYFIGSMVAVSKTDMDGKYFEVVDGQQRITTLLILFGAMKCFLYRQKSHINEKTKEFQEFIERSIQEFEVLIYNKKTSGFSFVPELKLKINRDYGYDFNEYLNDLIACKDGEPKKGNTEENNQIMQRYLNNYKFLLGQIENMFLDETSKDFTESKAQQFSKFAQFLRIRVAMIVITASSFSSAYFIFEVLNNRGLPLNNKDLTRNFLISEFVKAEFSDTEAAKKWYELEDNYLFPPDFIGRWVESKKASQQQYSAFNDLEKLYKDNYKDSINKKAIELFYDDFKTDLYYFDFFEDTTNIEDKCLAFKIEFLKKTNNIRYTTNFILSAMRYFAFDGKTNEEFYKLLDSYELFVVYTLLKPYKRFSSTTVYEAIDSLNSKNLSKAHRCIELSKSEKKELKGLLAADIFDNYIAKLLIAKYFWIKECETEDVVSVALDFDKATLEHIFPQTPTANTNWANHKKFPKKFADEYTYKLGNMTLLTHKVNATIKNGDFETKKQPEYKKTKLDMTVRLGELADINSEYIQKRHIEITSKLIEHFGL